MAEPRLTDPQAYPDDPTDTCDMIMKGGITSGVVYPRAACSLATRFRFRQIGGASAGAIAAAAVAAAESGRRSGGFPKLYALPTELGDGLAELFQPSPSTKPAFTVLGAWLEPEWGAWRKVASTAWTVVRHAWGWFLAAFVVLLVPAFVAAVASQGPPGDAGGWFGILRAMLVWVPPVLAVAWLIAAIVLVRRTLRALPANGYGLCDGHTSDPAVGSPPLTDWLTGTLDELAGLAAGAGPLTFGRLWGEEADAAYRQLLEREAAGAQVSPQERRRVQQLRRIDLEVMTTNLTFRRPYRFPFDTRIFYFCEQRLRAYFPGEVVDHMVRCSVPADDTVSPAGAVQETIAMQCPCHRERVRSLPPAPDLPVVLAARLSLSFPGLISAVPLLCVDYSRRPGKRRLIETWFSDGGISSNFPMHLFDSPWPARPTFGVNLLPLHPDFPDQLVWRPPSGASGILPRSHSIGSMPGFLGAILDTMQNWVDTTQITLPGFRDRVAEVRLRGSEGGMNLKMPKATIEALADRGGEAAALFGTFDFPLHQWIRYRVMMSELDDLLERMRGVYDGEKGYATLRTFDEAASGRYGLDSVARAKADQAATAGLMDLADAWTSAGHPANGGRVPRPKPSLRIVPRQ